MDAESGAAPPQPCTFSLQSLLMGFQQRMGAQRGSFPFTPNFYPSFPGVQEHSLCCAEPTHFSPITARIQTKEENLHLSQLLPNRFQSVALKGLFQFSPSLLKGHFSPLNPALPSSSAYTGFQHPSQHQGHV